MIRTYAALVTDENVDQIIAEAAKWDLKVDHLKDEYKDEYAEFGVQTYAILSINYQARHATFTTAWDDGFEETWNITETTHGPFNVVTLKNPTAR